MIAVDNPEESAAAVRLADTFCRQARLRSDRLFDGLWHNTDGADRSLSSAVLAGEFRWLEDGVLDVSIPGPWIADAEHGPSKAENVHRPV
jgi:hypothetical protein